MKKLLQLETYGMKNIENPITLSFCNLTIEKGIKKLNNVKGIFGYNGAGKSSLITSVDIYKSIVLNHQYLLQNEEQLRLSKLINSKLNSFYISMVFLFRETVAIKHAIKLEKNKANTAFIISEESISISTGRTLNDPFKVFIEKKGRNDYIFSEIWQDDDKNKIINSNMDYTSIISFVINQIIEEVNNLNHVYSDSEKIIIDLFSSINNIEVYLSDSDRHNNSQINKESVLKVLDHAAELREMIDHLPTVYLSDEIVSVENIEEYRNENKKLERFIQIFKPEVKEIKLDLTLNKKEYRIRKIFLYDDYGIELEYESSGIRQLVKLFSYLNRCANGGIVFIDEVDVNINTVYFEKLISYFSKYGEGQLIFTTHNVESMNSLKNQGKSIVVLGVNNKTDVWVGKGNKSPITDYMTGVFPNSPMNVEDFDFLSVFQEDNE